MKERDSLNLDYAMSLKLAGGIRRESEYYIRARSTGCNKADIDLKPTVNAKTTKALQTGCVHIEVVMTGKIHGNSRLREPDDSEFAGEKNKGLKKVKQSNHNVYTIPYGMEPWADEPLYLLVARWGLQQKRWINRNDIAAVFHIPDRQASFQLSYISRKKERVACRTRYVPTEDTGHQRVEIFIDGILPALVESQTHASPRRRNAPAKQTGIISRGVGSAMADNTGLWERLLKACREERDDE
ncbi:TPA: CaiF/GrlA family transcriptional regulator [Salmonella enterica subsp. enterica serovar Muenchen]